jgi:hypothetical protein
LAAVIVPFAEEIGIASPPPDTPSASWTRIVVELTPGSKTADTFATTPSGIAPRFNPTIRHLRAFASPAHMTVFPADARAGPSSTVKRLMLAGEYWNIH